MLSLRASSWTLLPLVASPGSLGRVVWAAGMGWEKKSISAGCCGHHYTAPAISTLLLIQGFESPILSL